MNKIIIFKIIYFEIMKHLLVFLLVVNCVFSQSITVDNTTFTPSQLTSLLLGNSCANSSNITFSSAESVAYFNQNNSNFGLEEGVIIRNGNALLTSGSYTGDNLSSQTNTNSDSYLQNLANQSGQTLQVTDVAFLSFDFTSISSSFSFDFIFASNEYGEWQCGFSDVFAFVLTDLTTNLSQNLAIIPGTSSPVSVLTIRDQVYNGSCNSVNPTFFDVYNVDNPENSVMNMRGYTKVMTATAEIVPNRAYNIRLMIGDVVDADFDSAIFLSSGAFQNNIDLGATQTICEGLDLVLQTGYDDSVYTHQWFKDEELIPNENEQTLSVNEPGLYEVLVTLSGTDCEINGSILLEPLVYQSPISLTVCINPSSNPTFDLTTNNSEFLEIENTDFTPVYFASETDFLNNQPITNITNYPGVDGQTIYIGLFNSQTQTFCSEPLTFNLNVLDVINLEDPGPILVCFNERFNIDLTEQIPNILDGINPNLVEVSFYLSEPVSGSFEGLIENPDFFAMQDGVLEQTIWVQVTYLIDDACLDFIPINLEVVNLPDITVLENAIVCESFELPVISLGNYYTGPGGSGTMLQAGEIIDFSTVIYIFSDIDENGCNNESSFNITVLTDYTVELEHCGSFSIPFVESAAFYTAPNGPDGEGELLETGTEITSSQTIHFYGMIDEDFCVELTFEITIYPLPLVDSLQDVVVCGSYTLPSLTHGQYRTSAGGAGVVLNPGQTILNTRTIYIFAENENCTNETSFTVTIVNNFQNVERCGTYNLPNPVIGGFYTQPAGQGTQIPNGSEISESMQIYYYVTTTELPNCTDNFSFTVSIVPLPDVDMPSDITICSDQAPYLLPILVNGQYFTEPNREGTQLFEGDAINETTTLYVNAISSQFGINCQSEHSYTITIRPLPPVENFSDIYSCAGYELPSLNFGTYYTESNASGDIIPAGTVINSEQTIYIFSEWDDLLGCSSESVFTVFPLGVELPDFQDVVSCDNYVLPALTLGDYFTEPNGGGNLIPSGTMLTTSQTIYVYVFDGSRLVCEDEKSFEITITQTPTLPVFQNIQACVPYQLPTLDNSNYQAYYSLDATSQNPIDPETNLFDIPGNYTIYVFASANDNAACQTQGQFQLNIFPPRTLTLTGGSICVDPISNNVIQPYVIQSSLNPQLFEVEWYLNGSYLGSASQWIANLPGEYTAVPIMLTPETPPLCEYEPASVTISMSSIPTAEIVVTNDFTTNSDVIVQILSGIGQYEYQLDDGTFQSSPIFSNVTTGYHTVTIRDVFGQCGEIVLEAIVINYPNYFTPNGDGTHDSWMIRNLVFLEGSTITIFDRYGKIMTQLNHNSMGWDGTYNGQPMPATDYWFLVNYQRNNEPRIFKAHFSLKR